MVPNVRLGLAGNMLKTIFAICIGIILHIILCSILETYYVLQMISLLQSRVYLESSTAGELREGEVRARAETKRGGESLNGALGELSGLMINA